jgi:branched-chain amino acid aminotransferase
MRQIDPIDEEPPQAIGATWLDGAAWRDDQTPPSVSRILLDRGLLLGDGLFETVAVRNDRPVLLMEHLRRLEASAAALSFPLPPGFENQVAEALGELVSLIPGHRLSALRITVTRGGGTEFGLDPPAQPSPTLLIRLIPVPDGMDSEARAWIVDWPRTDPDELLSGHKTTSSLWRIMAHQSARSHGANLAVITTVDGDIAEADTASLFAVVGGIVVTPPLSRGILAGTVRAFCLQELEAARRPFEERILLREELEIASEVFVTSSVSSIRPLRTIQGRELPRAAPVSDWLRGLYESLPGDDLRD